MQLYDLSEDPGERVNLYEQMLDGGGSAPAAYLERLIPIVESARNQLLLNLALEQLQRIYWTLVPDDMRNSIAPRLEAVLWRGMLAREEESLRKIYFNAFADVALTADGIQRVSDVWEEKPAARHQTPRPFRSLRSRPVGANPESGRAPPA